MKSVAQSDQNLTDGLEPLNSAGFRSDRIRGDAHLFGRRFDFKPAVNEQKFYLAQRGNVFRGIEACAPVVAFNLELRENRLPIAQGAGGLGNNLADFSDFIVSF